MDKIELGCANRETLGKKVKFLRRQSITPVHVYGRGTDSLALQCATPDLQKVLTQAGKTRLIDIHVGKSKKARSVMVRNIQKNAITGQLIHVDFYEVKATEKTKVAVPIVLVGEARALRTKTNILDHELNSITVECLPGDMPPSIPVDISSLNEPGQVVKVKDIKFSPEVTVLVDPERVIVRIGTTKLEREEVPVKKAEEVVAAAEGEAPAEGEAKAEGKPEAKGKGEAPKSEAKGTPKPEAKGTARPESKKGG